MHNFIFEKAIILSGNSISSKIWVLIFGNNIKEFIFGGKTYKMHICNLIG